MGLGVAGKGEGADTGIAPRVSVLIYISHLPLQSAQLLGEGGFLAGEFRVGKQLPLAVLGGDFECQQVAQALLSIGVRLLQGVQNGHFLLSFSSLLRFDLVDEPILQLLGNRQRLQELADLVFEWMDLYRALVAGRFFAFGAVVILVAQVRGLAHLGDGDLAFGTSGSAFRREFVLAVGADDLLLDLGGDGSSALAAPDQAGVGKGVLLRPGPSALAQ